MAGECVVENVFQGHIEHGREYIWMRIDKDLIKGKVECSRAFLRSCKRRKRQKRFGSKNVLNLY